LDTAAFKNKKKLIQTKKESQSPESMKLKENKLPGMFALH